MLKLDHNLLDQLGLSSLSQDDKDSLLAHMYEQLELRVGTVIAKQLTDEQLDEFEQLIDADKQEEALKWLQNNYPGYKQVVQAQLKQLTDELQQNKEQILGTSQSAQSGKEPAQ